MWAALAPRAATPGTAAAARRALAVSTCPSAGHDAPPPPAVPASAADTLRVAAFVSAARARGHLFATLDPLRRVPRGPWLAEEGGWSRAAAWTDPLLTPLLRRHDPALPWAARADRAAAALRLPGGPAAARAALFDLGGPGDLAAGPPAGRRLWRLPDLVDSMLSSYCGTLSAELAHLPPAQQAWLAARLEARTPPPPAASRATLRLLARAGAFEAFLARRFPRSKRFGLEGIESLLVGVAAAAERCSAHGVTRLQVGTPHRGRLNMLANVLGTPAGQICAEMEATQSEFAVGDVKYHLGRAATLAYGPGPGGGPPRALHVSVAPNPSHLEAVGPVVLGMVRAQQAILGDGAVAGLLVHGDAAFSGLGIVAETLSLARVPGYATGGTLHIVANNQVGFTTPPAQARSGPHPTDLARAAGAAVLHVCADDPDAVAFACALAADWRAAWRSDAVVDVVGFRRHGHNELDDPESAQPVTHAAIGVHPGVVAVYADALAAAGVASRGDAERYSAAATAEYEAEHAAFARGEYAQSADDWLCSSWQGDALAAISGPAGPDGVRQRQEPTGLPLDTLRWVGRAATTLPPGFDATPAASKALAARARQLDGSDPRIDFATAEALAYGSLALHRRGERVGSDLVSPPNPPDATADPDAAAQSGLNTGAYSVRLTGQDSERGTFSQRWAVLRERGTGRRLVLLDAMRPGAQERVQVWNTPLNEAACLSYEYGYSLGAAGRALVVWEAQFGDFANNAQAAIDLFVAAAEERWGQQSGLVLLLPHGFDGQGPDHSSARVERFLQLCNDDGDFLPGDAGRERREVAAAFAALDAGGGGVDLARAVRLLDSLGAHGGEAAEALWAELGLDGTGRIDSDAWHKLMTRYLRRNAEARANLFVVSPSTPAQLFHVLRRQLNRPFAKPLVVAAPKWLHVHGAATSSLGDLGVGTFFNRVIDDGKASDNTRHRAAHPGTGEAFLVPPHAVRRVLLCCGQIYYTLSAARRARRVRDVVLVRVEQLSPFPHDLVAGVVGQYGAADVVWVQEEPKNQGAWRHVKPRVDTALRELLPAGPGGARTVRYVGRAPAGTTATASAAIHREETRAIVDAAFADDLAPVGAESFAQRRASGPG